MKVQKNAMAIYRLKLVGLRFYGCWKTEASKVKEEIGKQNSKR